MNVYLVCSLTQLSLDTSKSTQTARNGAWKDVYVKMCISSHLDPSPHLGSPHLGSPSAGRHRIFSQGGSDKVEVHCIPPLGKTWFAFWLPFDSFTVPTLDQDSEEQVVVVVSYTWLLNQDIFFLCRFFLVVGEKVYSFWVYL